MRHKPKCHCGKIGLKVIDPETCEEHVLCLNHLLLLYIENCGEDLLFTPAANSYFSRFIEEDSVEEIRDLSVELNYLHMKYTSGRYKMEGLCRLPHIKPTGGSSPLVRWEEE